MTNTKVTKTFFIKNCTPCLFSIICRIILAKIRPKIASTLIQKQKKVERLSSIVALVSSGSCLKLNLCSFLDIRLFSTKLSCQLFWGWKQEILFDYNLRAPLKPSLKSVYDFPNIPGIKFVLFLCFSISHMQEHTIEHRFQWCLNPKYNCVKSKL